MTIPEYLQILQGLAVFLRCVVNKAHHFKRVIFICSQGPAGQVSGATGSEDQHPFGLIMQLAHPREVQVLHPIFTTYSS